MTRFLRLGSALALAGAMAMMGALPVMAGTTGPGPGSGTVPPGTCGVILSAGASNGVLDIVGSTPCAAGQAPTSCQVIVQGGQLPSPIERTFAWPCAAAFTIPHSTTAGSPWEQFIGWANTQINTWDACTGGVAAVVCSTQNLMRALNAHNVVGTLISYASGAMSLPFYAQNGLTSWITTTHQNILMSVYKIMAFLGLSVAAIAGAMRVVADAADNRRHSGVMLVQTGLRFGLALTFITGFFALAQWAIPLFNNLASGVYEAIMSKGIGDIFSTTGHLTPQAIIGASGAGIAGLFAAIIALLLMLYLFVMFLMRDVILAFGIALAPIAIGLAVWDTRNDLFMHWRNLFIGGLLMSLAGAVGVGVTFAIVGGMLAAVQVGTSGLLWFLSIVMMIGGLFATTKLMNVVMRGAMSHRSPTSLLLGMGEGAILGMGVRKAITAGSARVATTAGVAAGAAGDMAHTTGLHALGGSIARGLTGGSATHQATGVMGHASMGTQRGMVGVPDGAMDTAIASDPQGQQILDAATAHMDPGASYGARLAELHASGGQSGHKLSKMLVENGIGKAQLLNSVAPKQVRFSYDRDEFGAMMDLAHNHSRAQADKVVKDAANWGAA